MTTQTTNTFPPELWNIIFKEVSALRGFNEDHVDPAPHPSYDKWIRGIRLLSTAFNKSVENYFWESIGTDKAIPLQRLLLGSNPRDKTMINSIHKYTKRLFINGPLDQFSLMSALQLIAGCKLLESFSWEFSNTGLNNYKGDDRATIEGKYDEFSSIVSKCCHDFMNKEVPSKSYDFEFQTSNDRLTMRRRLGKPKYSINSRDSGTITPKVLDRVKLTKYTAGGQGHDSQLHLRPCGTEFPATRKLKLVNCFWQTPLEIPMTWNFKNVRSLSVNLVDP
ncbi:hypothetical protein IFR05_008051 [Cadophora sp. M221]|nr:hypothetical protein IFR05_008051 [Cadophora sp. M221]